MQMTGSEIVFLTAACAGFLLLALAFVLGEFLGHDSDPAHAFSAGAVEAHSVDLDAPSWLSTRVLTAGLTGFGITGLTVARLGLPPPLAWPAAVAGGVVVAAGTLNLVLGPLARQQSNSVISSS